MPELLAWQVYFLAAVLGLVAWQSPLPAATGLVLLWWLARPRLPCRAAHLFFFVCFGLGVAVYWAAAPGSSTPMAAWMQAREKVEVSARVAAVETAMDRRLRLILDDVSCRLPGGGEDRLPGKLVWTWEKPVFVPAPGQRLEVQLRIKPVRGFLNPGAWNSGEYWGWRGVFYRAYSRGERAQARAGPEPSGFLWSARMGLRDRVLDALTSTPGRTLEQGQALIMALLFGDRFWLDSELYDRVARASLVHSLALSGLHLGFMAALGWGLAWLLGRLRPSIFLRLPRPKLAVLLAAPLILLYLWLGQGTPSLWRAALMFAFWGVLLLRNRGRVLLDGLFLALAVILAVSPLSVFDLRLQLSALAVASIAVFLQTGVAGKLWDGVMPRGTGWPGRALRFCLGVLAVSFCVGLALLPLEVSEFHRVTPWFALNLLWLPVLGFVILPLGFLGLLLTALPGASAVGGLFLSAASFLLQGFADILAYLDGAGMLEVLVPLRPGWAAMVGYWVLLLAFALWVWRRKGGGWSASGRAVALAGLFLLVWPSMEGGWRELRGGVQLTMLDVGQGQGLAVYWPGGGMLLDGGGSFSRTFDIGKAVTAPALAWNRPPALDIVAASHPDMDHGRGIIYPLAEFDVGAFVFNGDWPHKRDTEALSHALERANLTPRTLRAGETFSFGNGIELEVLHPPAGFRGAGDNDRSLVLRLTWNGQGLALLPGDLEQKGIATLLASGADLSARVLVLPHHGSRTSVSPALYDRVRPDLALASIGFLNVFGYPHREVAAALKERGIPLLTTAEHGAMTVFWADSDAPGEVETTVP